MEHILSSPDVCQIVEQRCIFKNNSFFEFSFSEVKTDWSTVQNLYLQIAVSSLKIWHNSEVLNTTVNSILTALFNVYPKKGGAAFCAPSIYFFCPSTLIFDTIFFNPFMTHRGGGEGCFPPPFSIYIYFDCQSVFSVILSVSVQ